MIEGVLLKQAIISAANNISNHKVSVDELNVFPVPDGDTGTNMSMTMSAAVKALENLTNCTASTVADATSAALLRGARGNSGVILSLLFRGFSKGFKDKKNIGIKEISAALSSGVEAAYKAVMKPTEGTMLTVARVSAEYASECISSESASKIKDPVILWTEVCAKARETLAETPKMLPVLEKAGVVDAGGMGLCIIFEGMLEVFKGGEMIQSSVEKSKPAPANYTVAAEYEGEITFTYCTEYIVNKSLDAKGAIGLRAVLETMGDSVVVVDDEDIIKVHVHTDNPGIAVQEGLKYGALTNMKIENMREQHQTNASTSKAMAAQPDYLPVDPEIPYGFVAVAAGEGLESLFKDLGAAQVVTGGQTMNPSTQDILKAVEATPAKTVFVLPNNKNIIMAAEQTVPLADRKVCVLQTRTIPQGVSAMLAFDPSASLSANRAEMTKAVDRVSTGQITFAARDSEFDGHKIKKDEIMAMDNGKLAFVEKDLNKACLRLVKQLVKRNSAYVTIIYGCDVSEEQAQATYDLIRSKLGEDIEISMVNGGQPVYYYILSVE